MAAKRRQSLSVQEEDAFKMVIDELMEELAWHPEYEQIQEATDWLLKVVDYNVPHGKQIRGRGVITAYKSFVGNATKDELKPLYVLGWCIELFGAAFYITEDIMRRSITRRGQLAWYLVEEVGNRTINDALLLSSIVHFFLDRHFKGQQCYKFICQLFHKSFFNTALGQNKDSRIGINKGFQEFTMNNYFRVSKYKVGYFSFYLPMAIGKVMADGGCVIESELQMIEEISLEMGHLFQVQDDYLDCFGNPEITGKKGTAIQGNRCSWFIVRALQKADCGQEKILKDNYGKHGADSFHKVIKIFKDLDLVEEYKQYEMHCYNGIMKRIAKLPENIPGLYFKETMDIILKREK